MLRLLCPSCEAHLHSYIYPLVITSEGTRQKFKKQRVFVQEAMDSHQKLELFRRIHTTWGILYTNTNLGGRVEVLTIDLPGETRYLHFPASHLQLCSSSAGAALFRGSSSTYFVAMPMVHLQDPRGLGFQQLPRSSPPSRHFYKISTPAISVSPTSGIMYVSCPIWLEGDVLLVKTYSSGSRTWRCSNAFRSSDFLEDTATCWGSTAYWLTVDWLAASYDPVSQSVQRPPLRLPNEYGPVLMARLGTVMGRRFGAVVVGAAFVALYILDRNGLKWEMPAVAFLNVCQRDENPRWNQASLTSDALNPACILCKNLPRPVRFQTSSVRMFELPLVIDGKVFV